jgi:hypothetical protein
LHCSVTWARAFHRSRRYSRAQVHPQPPSTGPTAGGRSRHSCAIATCSLPGRLRRPPSLSARSPTPAHRPVWLQPHLCRLGRAWAQARRSARCHPGPLNQQRPRWRSKTPARRGVRQRPLLQTQPGRRSLARAWPRTSQRQGNPPLVQPTCRSSNPVASARVHSTRGTAKAWATAFRPFGRTIVATPRGAICPARQRQGFDCSHSCQPSCRSRRGNVTTARENCRVSASTPTAL